jgi:hypothetical protein
VSGFKCETQTYCTVLCCTFMNNQYSNESNSICDKLLITKYTVQTNHTCCITEHRHKMHSWMMETNSAAWQVNELFNWQ